jgi:hypothetical protein
MNIRSRAALRAAIASILLVGAYALAEAKTLPTPPVPPAADASCGPEDIVLGALAKKYNESVTWRGMSGALEMVITMAPKGKTWTMLGVMDGPKGSIACMLNSGEDATSGPDGMIV